MPVPKPQAQSSSNADQEEGKNEPKVQEVTAEEAAKIEKKEIPKQDVRFGSVPEKVSKISTYNGAETEKYNWSQSTKNVDVQVPLPKGTTSKMMIVEIKTKHLKVQIKGQSEPIMCGELCEKVRVEESFWNVEDQ